MSRGGTVVLGPHSARYQLTGSTLTITSVLGVKSAQLGRLPAEVLAGILLREQVADVNNVSLASVRIRPKADICRRS